MILCFIVALCPKSWIRGLYGSCFKLFSRRLVWNAAKSACSRMGTRLAVLNSQGLKETANISSWIGLHRDPKSSSRWLWIDGSRTIYPNWGSGEPNNVGGSEDCVEIRPDGKLNDMPCNRSLPYFCEIIREYNLQ